MSRITPSAGTRRQFRLLVRASIRHLLTHVTAARDADPVNVAIWLTALATAPALLFAVRNAIDYPFLLPLPPEAAARALLTDRVFFVLYGMLTAALLASLVWEVLVPTREDQEILGVLPVRPPTVAAARLTAAVVVATSFTAAVSVPAALLFGVGSSALPMAGGPVRAVAGHLAATMPASLLVFLTLLAARSMLVHAGERIVSRAAVGLQLVAIVALIEVFFFLPAVTGVVIDGVQGGGAWWLPPVWFAALYGQVAGSPGTPGGLPALGLTATIAAAVLAIAVTLPPAGWMARRALDGQAAPHAGMLSWLPRAVARSAGTPAVRSVLVFALASLARSRRHLLLLVSYLGVGIALAALRLAAELLQGRPVFDQPRSFVLAVPLVLVFFTVVGLRACCAVPTDLDANWAFRLQTPSVGDVQAAIRLLLLWLGVAPVVAACSLASAWLWGWHTALTIVVLDVLAGVLLCELLVASWTKVPFASGHEPAIETVKSRWPWFVAALWVFGFGLADLHRWVLDSPAGMAVYALVGILAVGGAYGRTHRMRRGRAVRLDPDVQTFEGLRLSPAEE